MIRAFEIVFWLSVCWLGYVYIGYGVGLWILGLFKTFRPAVSDQFLPKVSVLVSARNEQTDIRWKVEETLSWDYPRQQLEMLVASDASDDATDDILESITDSRLKYLRLEQRQGKNEALNRLAQRATGELLFFTDANARIEATTLRRMVRYFADPKVGCVTGSECTIRESEAHAATTGIRSAIGYESFLSSLESKIGSVLVCDGSIFCIRRELFHQLEPELANDLELPLDIGARGYSILFEPAALSYEKASPPSEEFQRKRRICGQGALALWRLRGQLRGLRGWQFASRKVLRWMGLIPMALIFVSSLALMRIPFYGVALAAQILGLLLGAIGAMSVDKRRESSWITALPYFFILANAGAFSGVIGALRGERFSVWQSASNSRGTDRTVTVEDRNNAHAAATVHDTGNGSLARGSAFESRELSTAKCIFSIDVEDWFHILDVSSTPPMSQWDSLPSRVERNFQKLLDILDEHNSQATCFFLGWVAERFPHLVREAVARGHEIASHGYSHVLVCHESADSFHDDVVRSRSVLQDISGQPVLGYRAPGFSVTTDTPWFFEKLMDAGYRYDSSVFPGTHGHGGLSDAPSAPYEVEAGSGFVEFPVSVEHVAGRAVCFFGGGYLRLFPYSAIRHMAHRVLAKGRPVVFYIHPREIDSSAPRLPMSFTRRFRSYVNLDSTEPKLRNLLSEFPVTSFREFMAHELRLAPGYQEQAGALVAKQA